MTFKIISAARIGYAEVVEHDSCPSCHQTWQDHSRNAKVCPKCRPAWIRAKTRERQAAARAQKKPAKARALIGD